MRLKNYLLFLLIFTLFFCFSMVSHGWQGRMAGMEDPYGLIADESDYLIHVAKIADDKAVNFYGGYRFTYTEVDKWKIEFTPAPYDFNFYGKEINHKALLGSSFALGPGRMGVFFVYDETKSDLKFQNSIADMNIKNDNDLDNFHMRLIYGIPVGNFLFGAEAGIAYRKEKNSLHLYGTGGGVLNYHIYEALEANSITPPVIPYDAAYWEIPLKVGLAGKLGTLDTQFTMRGGVIIAGDNTLRIGVFEPGFSIYDDIDGDAKGWSAGADLWLRYNLGNGLSLPFLIRADYLSKVRDARGNLVNMSPLILFDYENKETAFNFTLGGGVNKTFSQNTSLAAGVYYSYLTNNKEAILLVFDDGIYSGEYFLDDLPSVVEHRVTLRLAGEEVLSPAVTLRTGLGCFYGLVTQDIVFGEIYPSPEKIKLASEGYQWGVGASFGASIKLTPVTLEPFINGGYQHLKLSDDSYENGILVPGVSRNDKREQWYVGGGLAVKFGQ